MSSPVVDFHSHVLPCMDDGSPSLSESLGLLRRLRQTGTDIVVATPHFYCQNESQTSFLERRAKAAELLLNSTANDGSYPQIRIGAEVALCSGLDKCDLSSICIGASDVILIEMPYVAWSDYYYSMLQDICFDKKKTVILAHFERYLFMQKRETAAKMADLPVTIQINADSLLGFFTSRKTIRMFEEGKAHILGSDCHDLTARPPRLDRAREAIRRKSGQGTLDRIDRNSQDLIEMIDNTETRNGKALKA